MKGSALHSHSSSDRAVNKLRLGEIFSETRDKAAMSANITAEYRATGVYPINPSVIPEANSARRLITHSEDGQDCNVATATEKPTAALLLQQKIGKDCAVPGTSGNVVSTNRNDDALACCT